MDRKAENRTRLKFLAVGEACVAIYSDLLQALEREHLSASKINLFTWAVWKRFARWFPHNLTEVHKRGRLEWRSGMMNKFDGRRSSRVRDTAAGDEM